MDAATVDPEAPAVVEALSRRRSLTARVLSGGAWSLAGRMGSIGSIFCLNIILVRSLDTGAYAAFLTAMSVVPLLAMVATAGVPITLIRVMRGPLNEHRRRQAWVGAATLTVLAGGCTALAYSILVGAGLFPDEPRWQVLRDAPGFVAAWFVLSALCMTAASFLQAEDDFHTAALVGARSGGVIPNSCALAAVAALWAAGMMTLAAMLWVQVAAYAVAMVLAAWFVSRVMRRPIGDRTEGGPSGDPGRPPTPAWFLRESWPNLFNQTIAVALTELDLFWVACLAGEDTVANYGVVRNLRLFVAAPLLVASVVLPPFVAELYARGDLARLERLVRGAATALSAPSLIALTVLLAAPTAVIRLLYGAEFASAATALQIMSLGAVVFVLTGNNGMTLTMVGRHRELLACGLSGLVLYLVICPPLVARFGLEGAAAAFTVQTIAVNVLVTLRVKQLVGIWTIPLASWAAIRNELELIRSRSRARS